MILKNRKQGKGYQFLTLMKSDPTHEATWQPMKGFLDKGNTVNEQFLSYIKRHDLFLALVVMNIDGVAYENGRKSFTELQLLTIFCFIFPRMEKYDDPIEDYTQIRIANFLFPDMLDDITSHLNNCNYLSWWLFCLCVVYREAYPSHYFTEDDEEILLTLIELTFPGTFEFFPQASFHCIYFYAIGVHDNSPRRQTYHDLIRSAINQLLLTPQEHINQQQQRNSNRQIKLRFPNRDHVILPVPTLVRHYI